MRPASGGDSPHDLPLCAFRSKRDLARLLGLLLGLTNGLEATDVWNVDLRQDADDQRHLVDASVVENSSPYGAT